MGSYIELKLGDHRIDWAKNGMGTEHGVLFQSGDFGEASYEYVDDEGRPLSEIKEAAVRPLTRIVGRLELMGFSLKRSAMLVSGALRDHEEFWSDLSWNAGRTSEYSSLVRVLDENGESEFAQRFASKFISASEQDDLIANMDFLSPIFEGLGAAATYATLRLLAEDPVLSSDDVSWNFADVVEGGWIDRESIRGNLGHVRPFLIVTEGSSDAKVIRHALELLRADIADFFSFVDMDKGYPFSGSSNLHRFCKGLVSIGIENNVIALFDNDTEGCRQYDKTSGLSLPDNIRVVKLPHCEQLCAFETIGPDGETLSDINRAAASIECFLDLTWQSVRPAKVRWTSYDEISDSWQGALIDRSHYVKKFLGMKTIDSAYDYTKLDAVLHEIALAATEIAGSALTAELRR